MREAGQPWLETAQPCSLALALEGSRLKQQREWLQEQQLKRRRLEAIHPRRPARGLRLPTPTTGPKPLVPGQNGSDLPGSVSWGDAGGAEAPAGGPARATGSCAAADRDPLTCTALVPYRAVPGAWALLREADEPVDGAPRQGPAAVPLRAAEAADGEAALVLPGPAARHRGGAEAEAQLIPWERGLAIVPYKGPGCSPEPGSQAQSLESAALMEEVEEARGQDDASLGAEQTWF